MDWTKFQIGATLVEWFIKSCGAILPERWTMPNVMCGNPRNMASESSLAWWHIPVWVEKARLWQAESIGPCMVEIQIDSPLSASTRLEMLWSSLDGPQRQVTLFAGGTRVRDVIVAVRSEEDRQLTGHPGRLAPFFLPARVVRMTDDHALIHRNLFTDLLPGVMYEMTLWILVADRPYHHQSYSLRVPGTDAGNAELVFERSAVR